MFDMPTIRQKFTRIFVFFPVINDANTDINNAPNHVPVYL